MNDFESQSDDSPMPLGNRSEAGRRSAVDWQRVNAEPLPPSRGFFGWIGFILWRTIKWLLLLILMPLICYLLISGIGAWIPVNPDFQPTPRGIEIFVYSGNVHSELILPLKTPDHDWTSVFATPPSQPDGFSHIAIGWGDKEFYTQTGQWSDFDPLTAAKALFLPTESVLRVELVSTPYTSARSMSVKISPDQYASLCQHIEASMSDSQPLEGLSLGDHDQFYKANEKFHLFNTCNNWVGNAMKSAGIKVGRFTPLPKTVFWHLDN